MTEATYLPGVYNMAVMLKTSKCKRWICTCKVVNAYGESGFSTRRSLKLRPHYCQGRRPSYSLNFYEGSVKTVQGIFTFHWYEFTNFHSLNHSRISDRNRNIRIHVHSFLIKPRSLGILAYRICGCSDECGTKDAVDFARSCNKVIYFKYKMTDL